MLNSAKQYKGNKDKDQEARMMEKARIRKSCSRLHAIMSSLSARHWTALTAWIIAVCLLIPGRPMQLACCGGSAWESWLCCVFGQQMMSKCVTLFLLTWLLARFMGDVSKIICRSCAAELLERRCSRLPSRPRETWEMPQPCFARWRRDTSGRTSAQCSGIKLHGASWFGNAS